MKAVAAGGAAIATGFVMPAQAPAIAAGLVAVYIARLVFIDRENRRLHRRQPWRETLPLTAGAMLIAAALINERAMSVSGAIYTGLGVGWVAVVALDMLGGRLITMLQAAVGGQVPDPLPPGAPPPGGEFPPIGGAPPPADIPAPLADLVDQVDIADLAADRLRASKERP